MYKLLSWFGACVLAIALLAPAQAETFQYVYDETGQLIKAIDSTGTVIEYVYDEVGNMLEIKRSTVSGLAIFNFTPQQGTVGTKVTIQGQNFGATPANNTVEFNGIGATVLSATANVLDVTVPSSATTGPISVTVAGNTATSDDNFVSIGAPGIAGVAPVVWVDDSSLPNFQVTGTNLQNSDFTFIPPGLPFSLGATDPVGTTANLNILVPEGLLGTFVVVATNPVGSSDSTPTAANTLEIIEADIDPDFDGLTNRDEVLLGTNPFIGDTDGDGFGDGDEVAFGSNPLDPFSLPVDPFESPFEAVARPVAVLNHILPPTVFVGEAQAAPYSVLNVTPPADPGTLTEASASPVSMLNVVPVNLAALSGVITNSSSSTPGFGSDRVIDGDLDTSWFTQSGDAAPLIEVVLPFDAMVVEIKMFGNRESPDGSDFLAGTFELLDGTDMVLFTSGEVLLPAPIRDATVSVPSVGAVRKVRFTSTSFEGAAPGFAELEVLGPLVP